MRQTRLKPPPREIEFCLLWHMVGPPSLPRVPFTHWTATTLARFDARDLCADGSAATYETGYLSLELPRRHKCPFRGLVYGHLTTCRMSAPVDYRGRLPIRLFRRRARALDAIPQQMRTVFMLEFNALGWNLS